MAANKLIDPRERTLGTITLVLGLLGWTALVLGTLGIALIGLLVGWLIYLFAHSALIAHLRGNGVEISAEQRPDLHQQLSDCCSQLGIATPPKAYLLNGEGMLNAFATRFLGTEYVVLLSSTVDAMAQHPDGVRFYIGHELGHLRRKHLQGSLLRWPVLWLPLLGAAYSRARERSCDLHGAACCATPAQAAQALLALAAGGGQWASVDLAAFLAQARRGGGFWMSFHGLISGYPWVTERVARVTGAMTDWPRRHPLAWLLAAFVPFAGRLGGGFGALMLVYMVGVLAAVALPAYQDYTVRAQMSQAYLDSAPARQALATYFESRREVPDTLTQAEVPEQLPGGLTLSLDSEHMVLSVRGKAGELVFTPRLDKSGHVIWQCSGSEPLRPAQLPPDCR